jgi:insertion element IS1 protein InsB
MSCALSDSVLLLTQNASHARGGQQQAMVISELCPRCQAPPYKQNGHIHHGKQNHQCPDCGRQFVDRVEQDRAVDDTRALIERLRVGRMALRGLCRAVGGKLKWLSGFRVQGVEARPAHRHVQPLTWHGHVMLQCLEVEADELASFVQQKAHKPWIWIAMDALSRQVLAFHGGDRSRRSATRLWAKSPHAYRQHATFYPDQ